MGFLVSKTLDLQLGRTREGGKGGGNTSAEMGLNLHSAMTHEVTFDNFFYKIQIIIISTLGVPNRYLQYLIHKTLMLY